MAAQERAEVPAVLSPQYGQTSRGNSVHTHARDARDARIPRVTTTFPTVLETDRSGQFFFQQSVFRATD